MAFNIVVWIVIFGIIGNIHTSGVEKPQDPPTFQPSKRSASDFEKHEKSSNDPLSHSQPIRTRRFKNSKRSVIRENAQPSVNDQYHQDPVDFEKLHLEVFQQSSGDGRLKIMKRDGSGPVAEVPLKTVTEQLEITEYFTNALILTEAIHKGLTNISIVATDLMIIGQMKDDKDWLQKLESANIDAATVTRIEGLFEKLKPLQDIIEKGEPIDVPDDTIDNIITVCESVKTIDSAMENTEFLKSVITNYGDQKTFKWSVHEEYITLLLKLPSAVEAFLKFVSDTALFDNALKSVDLITDFISSGTHENLEKAYKTHETMSKQDKSTITRSQYVACIESAFNAVKKLRIFNSTAVSYEDMFKLFNLFEISHEDAVMDDNPVNLTEYRTLQGKFTVLKDVAQHNVSTSGNFDTLVESFEKFTASIPSSFEKVKMFRTVIDITEEFRNVLKRNRQASSGSSKISFIERFKSYKGVPNGFESLNLFTEHIGSPQSLPPDFFYSGIVERSDTAKQCFSQIEPFIRNNVGLSKMKVLSEMLVEITSVVKSDVYKTVAGSFTTIGNLLKDLPNVDETWKFLAEVIKQMEALKSKKVVDDLKKLRRGLTGSTSKTATKAIGNLLHQLPSIIKFVSPIIEAIGSFDVNGANSMEDEQKMYEKLKKVFPSYPEGLKKTENFNKIASSIKKEDIDTVVGKIQEKIKSQSEFANYNLPINEFPVEKIPEAIKKAGEVQDSMANIVKSSGEVNKIEKEIKIFENFKKFDNQLDTSDEIERTKEYLQGFKKLGKKPALSVTKESDAISKLMDGTTFGSQILEKLSRGVSWYQNLVAGTDSIKVVKDAIEKLKSTKQALMDRVGKILKGFETFQLSTQADLNVFAILENMPTIVNNSEMVKKWFDGVDMKELSAVETELKALTTKHRRKRVPTKDASTLHSFIVAIKNQKNNDAEQLSDGLRTLVESLSHVDCKKSPDDPTCVYNANNGSGSWLIMGISLGIAGMLLISAISVIVRIETEERRKNGTRRKPEVIKPRI